MNAPTVRYTTTTDGISIAYGIFGSGYTLVCMPPAWSHFARLWQTPLRQFWETLARRFRVVLYDSRGQGSSQRRLSDDHSLADYELDLQAVLEAAGRGTVMLFAMSVSTRVACRYAAANPAQVDAVVLWGSNVQPGWASESFVTLARLDWIKFVRTASRIGFPFMKPSVAEDLMLAAVSQQDWLKMTRVMGSLDDTDRSPRIQAPVLITNPSSAHPLTHDPDETRDFARRFGDVRVVTVDEPDLGLVSIDGGKPRLAAEIERFADEVVGVGPPDPRSDGESVLSERELDVLRLVASGMSNAQIAGRLFISPHTVAKHIANILSKTGTANRSEAAALAVRRGLI